MWSRRSHAERGQAGRCQTRAFGTLTGGVLAMAGWGAATEDGPVVMIVDGDPGVRVEGRCVVRTAAGEISEAIAAVVPFERRWSGTGVRCELASDGFATVEVS